MSDEIKIEYKFRRNPHFRFQYEEAQAGYVLLFPEGMVKLNGGAGEVMRRLDGKKTVEMLIQELKAAFPDVPDIVGDVLGMLRLGSEKNWIERV